MKTLTSCTSLLTQAFVVFALWIPLVGCGSGGSSGGPPDSTGSRGDDSDLSADFVELEGTVTDVDDLPMHFVVRVEIEDSEDKSDDRDAGYRPGSEVVVLLDGTQPMWLHLPSEPGIGPFALLPGLKVRVRGKRSSDVAFMAEDVRVRPGRFDGIVASVEADQRALTVRSIERHDPFGGNPVPDSVTARFASGAEVEGGAESIEAFFLRYEDLLPGQVVHVRLYGIGDGSGGILAYHVEVDVDD